MILLAIPSLSSALLNLALKIPPGSFSRIPTAKRTKKNLEKYAWIHPSPGYILAVDHTLTPDIHHFALTTRRL
jgi:hypothetical protein